MDHVLQTVDSEGTRHEIGRKRRIAMLDEALEGYVPTDVLGIMLQYVPSL